MFAGAPSDNKKSALDVQNAGECKVIRKHWVPAVSSGAPEVSGGLLSLIALCLTPPFHTRQGGTEINILTLWSIQIL